MDYERVNNISKAYTFRRRVPAGEAGYIDQRVSSHGYVNSLRVRFAAGENGTLKIRPVMIIPPEIQIDLYGYADDDKWLIGDNELIESGISFETENDAVLRIYYENTADEGTVDSFVNVDIGVTYYSVVEVENVIGPRSRGWLNGRT